LSLHAGVKDGDRIIEVNGVNVEGDLHAECAAKIQAVTGQVKLLLVDAPADEYFHKRRLPLSSKQPYVGRKHAAERSAPSKQQHQQPL